MNMQLFARGPVLTSNAFGAVLDCQLLSAFAAHRKVARAMQHMADVLGFIDTPLSRFPSLLLSLPACLPACLLACLAACLPPTHPTQQTNKKKKNHK